MFLKKKRNYHETIYGGAMDIKKLSRIAPVFSIQELSIDMKSRLLGFLKQAKNHVSD